MNKKVLLSVFGAVFALVCCEYDLGYKEIWPPQEDFAPDPVITKIVPDSACGGVVTLKIIGRNFDPNPSLNYVCFDNVVCEVLESSDTSITVNRPIGYYSDSTEVKVVVSKAKTIPEFGPYKMEPGVVNIGGSLGEVYSFAVSRGEDIYYHKVSDKKVYRYRTGEGEVEFGSMDKKSSCMRFHPSGKLLIQRSNYKYVYYIDTTGGEAQKFFRLPDRASYFDIGENGIYYFGGTKGLLVVSEDGSIKLETGYYVDDEVTAVRVFDDYVYVATNNDTVVVFRNEIIREDSVSAPEPYLYRANMGKLSDVVVNDMTFSEDGVLFLVVDGDFPILVVKEEGVEPLYEGILEGDAIRIFWGNGMYLYYARSAGEDSGIYRVIAGREGAPYYGRD